MANLKTCPYCAEEIGPDSTTVCKHCGRDIAGISPSLPVVPKPVRHSGKTMLLILGVLVLVGIALVYFR